MGSPILVSQPVLIMVLSVAVGAVTPGSASAQCQQTGWTQPVIGWDLALGSGLKLSGPDGPMFVPWQCGSGIQPTVLIKGPRPFRRRSDGSCYYVVELPYRNAGMKPTPVVQLHVAATASYEGFIDAMVQTPVLSLAPGQTALVRGDLTVFPGETALGGEVNDIYTNSNYHPADPRAENNEARSRITVPEGC